MNPVEIADAVTALAEQPFDPAEFPYAFLLAFGNKEAVIARLRKGSANKSDIGGVLQPSNVHIKVCPPGAVPDTLEELRQSPANSKARAKFILATDGDLFEAEDLISGETVACPYAQFDDHLGFFLPLAGITTVKQIRENAFDIKATGRLNRLYVQLLKDNPDWASADRRPDMNHFMARLIFCFFAEDTGIFHSSHPFTDTVAKMSQGDEGNTHSVIETIFRAMNIPTRHDGQLDDRHRKAAGIPGWADAFPFVNGGLFSGSAEVPRFTRIARSYLLHIGRLEWQKINPDIFGSMIQAVADDDERSALGMHYTSVPNILKVLNPLFLDDLREKLEEAGDNGRKLLNLRSRMARIRVFDPACGSGNFLVIAYKEMREIEAGINKRRGEPDRPSDIPLTNFRGIELRDFPAEIARLALIIAEYQCDVLYRGQKEALADFLPLNRQNWITCGNALRLDWLSICPPTGTGVKLHGDDLFNTPLDQAQIDFENEGGETYICGNPPYLGFTWQTAEQKSELKSLFEGRTTGWKSLDYVSGWFIKAADFGTQTTSVAAFVTTNSICQGEQVPILWPLVFTTGHQIVFAHTSFKWTNLASHNAGVTVAIVGLARDYSNLCTLYSIGEGGSVTAKKVEHINAYLVPSANVIVNANSRSPESVASMVWGNKPTDGGHLVLSSENRASLLAKSPDANKFIRQYYGAAEFIRGLERFCVWVEDSDEGEANAIPELRERFARVRAFREASKAAETRPAAKYPHKFRQIQAVAAEHAFILPQVSSERRGYLPVGLLSARSIISNLAFALYDAPLWNMALIASRIHLVWIATVCGKLETRYRYSNTLGWNTFPLPTLTEQNKADLNRCAEAILLAREAHFPATIADVYDPDRLDAEFPDLRAAHELNDETLERIYIGRRFRNDTERLEKLFELYTQMTATSTTAGRA